MSETSGHLPGVAAECDALIRQMPGATAVEQRADGLWMTAPGLDVVAMAEMMRQGEARLSAITGLALPNRETAIIYHYCLGATAINIRATTRGQAISSITTVTRAADWSEREISDLYGVSFVGHPHPGRLLRPPSLSPGFFRVPREKGAG